MNRKGFSLLELLVVVLIIGILAAIALPQYQLAVDKADFMKYETMARSIRDAYDHYVMIYGVGTADFDKLSVSLPDDFTTYSNYGAFTCLSNSEMFCCMSNSGEQHGGLVNCGKKDSSVIYVQSFFSYNNKLTNRRGRCLAKENHKRANRLCAALGKDVGVGNTWTPEGYTNRYQNYLL